MVHLSNAETRLWHACPECGEVVADHGYKTTLVGYSGDWPPGHNHDGNCRTFGFKCKCGTMFSVRPVNICPVPGCDWHSKEQCFCHPEGARVYSCQ